MNEVSLEVFAVSLESIRSTILNRPSGIGLETFKSSASIRLALEENEGIISKVFKAIINFLKKIWNFFFGWIVKFETSSNNSSEKTRQAKDNYHKTVSMGDVVNNKSKQTVLLLENKTSKIASAETVDEKKKEFEELKAAVKKGLAELEAGLDKYKNAGLKFSFAADHIKRFKDISELELRGHELDAKNKDNDWFATSTKLHAKIKEIELKKQDKKNFEDEFKQGLNALEADRENIIKNIYGAKLTSASMGDLSNDILSYLGSDALNKKAEGSSVVPIDLSDIKKSIDNASKILHLVEKAKVLDSKYVDVYSSIKKIKNIDDLVSFIVKAKKVLNIDTNSDDDEGDIYNDIDDFYKTISSLGTNRYRYEGGSDGFRSRSILEKLSYTGYVKDSFEMEKEINRISVDVIGNIKNKIYSNFKGIFSGADEKYFKDQEHIFATYDQELKEKLEKNGCSLDDVRSIYRSFGPYIKTVSTCLSIMGGFESLNASVYLLGQSILNSVWHDSNKKFLELSNRYLDFVGKRLTDKETLT